MFRLWNIFHASFSLRCKFNARPNKLLKSIGYTTIAGNLLTQCKWGGGTLPTPLICAAESNLNIEKNGNLPGLKELIVIAVLYSYHLVMHYKFK